MLARYSEINQAQWKKLELGELTQEEVKISRYRIFFEEYGITASPEETAKCYEQNLAYEHEKKWTARLNFYRNCTVSTDCMLHPMELTKCREGVLRNLGLNHILRTFYFKKIGYHKPDKNFSTIVLHIFLILSWKRVSLWATAYPQISLVEKMPD